VGKVLPVKGSLQGHPDSGEIWQTRVNKVMESYEFCTTTHEPCLYHGSLKGKQILICRQVDGLLIARKDMCIVREFAGEIYLQTIESADYWGKTINSLQWLGYITDTKRNQNILLNIYPEVTKSPWLE
jgi:hypothetical protein